MLHGILRYFHHCPHILDELHLMGSLQGKPHVEWLAAIVKLWGDQGMSDPGSRKECSWHPWLSCAKTYLATTDTYSSSNSHESRKIHCLFRKNSLHTNLEVESKVKGTLFYQGKNKMEYPQILMAKHIYSLGLGRTELKMDPIHWNPHTLQAVGQNLDHLPWLAWIWKR